MLTITGRTKLLGIIGYPVEHSMSPTMQNAAIASLGLNYIYLPFPVKSANLSKILDGFASMGLVGFNVTIPHKQTIMPLLNEITDHAKMIGAVNTVWWTEKGWKGTNTDIDGFIAPLKQINRDWSQICPIILGNGGAARAVVVGCSELGCPEIHVFGRNKEKLAHFYQSWQNTPLKSKLKVHRWDNLSPMVSATELLINTTPVGMYPNINQSPLNNDQIDLITHKAIAYDLIYTPRPTLFLQQAQTKGATIIDGTEMLVQQGAAALQIWVKETPPINIMREALLSNI
jgi:shikimate dehydrogenase